MKILVCGGAGYIGSNMTAMLAAEGFEPIVFDNLSTGHSSAVGSAEFIEGDLADYELLVKTLDKYKIESVMHFAAFIEAGESVRSPLKFYHNNVSNTQNLLSAMESCGVNKFVFSSTAAVYGIPEKLPITEDSPKQPINPYGETKLAVERMCHHQSRAGKLRYATLRYFNACGAGANGALGEDHRPESHLIPLIIKAAMGKNSQVHIYGTDYPTPDGTCIRDYIHIEDLCRAHLLALEKLNQKNELIYNLGNGQGYSVKEVIDTVKKVSAKDFKVAESERRPGDPPVLTSDATKAGAELGWKPQYTELEKIITTAWQWHNEHPDGYPD
ncbi:MAG: UDP-glucose 4-epimerase GalE [Phycisphaerae bacterium]|nr:UDP-glucose 4-epimerase GalE [Phycisphaerae bacterium]NIP53721.1 UDP-glucose 4-epimerase GalE [Phycisphaerae bacterium]NIS52643.1 UDP-glucose 4-epimerase GalE [Phycisphaerae bacterium]NIU10122.1 UDP-glucose 4-epimerase GalE [Phycisphaerae bacterium]NIV02716.1 UDP-glucose 4-epimerase GalE [Phycisphaerae bacterium]